MKPIGILYEHPEWFRPLFAELDRRDLPYERIDADQLSWDPSDHAAPYSLVVNRVGASAFVRGHVGAVWATRDYLAYLESIGVPVVNGSRAHALNISKAAQLSLLRALDLPHPRSRVVNHVARLVAAAGELAYPIIVKPNIGGSGALIRRFERPDELRAAVAAGELDAALGLDSTLIVQEYHEPIGGTIVRVELLDGQLLYAIRIQVDPLQGFDICPADICQVPAGGEVTPDASGRRPLEIRVAVAPTRVVEAVRQVFHAAEIDLGGVEYLESERDGRLYFYDVNALSNFVTDAPRLVGFDPFARFVDYLERRAGLAGHPGLVAS